MANEYANTMFVPTEDKLPPQNSICPSCGGKIIKSNYGGMWCVGCKRKWRVSQFNTSPTDWTKSGTEAWQTKREDKIQDQHQRWGQEPKTNFN